MHYVYICRDIFKENAAKTSKIRFVLFSLGDDEVDDWAEAERIEKIPSIRLYENARMTKHYDGGKEFCDMLPSLVQKYE